MTRRNRIGMTILILAIACASSFLLALSTRFVYAFLRDRFNVTGKVYQDILFFSYFVWLGLLVTMGKPGLFGFHMGRCRRYWKLVLAVALFTGLSTSAYILLNGPTPYHGGILQLLPNLLLVPLGEEMIFRGILFVALLHFLDQLHPPKTSAALAILFSAIGFGLAHANNLFYNPIGFTLFQIFYSTVFGLVFGYVRYKTDSLYPPILFHAIMNTLGILL